MCFFLEATKRAINFDGKKNSKVFALFTAKLISFRRCNQEKGDDQGPIEKEFVSQPWPHFRLN